MPQKKLKTMPVTPMVEMPVTKLMTPWPIWLILVVAFLSGTWSAYFLVWQNLKRMGKPELAVKFARWGVGLIFLFQVVLVAMAAMGKSAGNVSQALLFGFPLWLEFKFFRRWREENPENKPRFQMVTLGWGAVGLVATFVMWYATKLIAWKLGL